SQSAISASGQFFSGSSRVFFWLNFFGGGQNSSAGRASRLTEVLAIRASTNLTRDNLGSRLDNTPTRGSQKCLSSQPRNCLWRERLSEIVNSTSTTLPAWSDPMISWIKSPAYSATSSRFGRSLKCSARRLNTLASVSDSPARNWTG